MSAPWTILIICLWVAVLLLAAAVVGLLRRVQGLENGAGIADVKARYAGVRGRDRLPDLPGLEAQQLSGGGLLLLLSSSCNGCRRFSEALRSEAGKDLLRKARTVLITDADGAALYGDLAVGHLHVQREQELVTALGVPAVPYALVVTASGLISAADLVPDLPALRALVDMGLHGGPVPVDGLLSQSADEPSPFSSMPTDELAGAGGNASRSASALDESPSLAYDPPIG